MSESTERISLLSSLMLAVYSICFFIFLLDTYLLPDVFSEYSNIEPEYRPVEQATRLAYLLVAAMAWRDFQQNKQTTEENGVQMGKILFSFSIIMIILENNWDLTLRESMAGRVIFAAGLGSVLVWLSWFTFNSDWEMPLVYPLLYILVLVFLGLGQIADTFHDEKGEELLDNEAVEKIGASVGLEETTELFAAWILFHAAWIWHNRDPKAIEFWTSSAGLKHVAGLSLFGIGNGFLAFTREGIGGHFISNELAMLGVFLMAMGAWLAIEIFKSHRKK